MLRQRLQSDSPWLPRLAAALTAIVGAVNIASALAPDIRWRGRELLQVEAVHTIEFFHAVALPAGAALLLLAPYLLKRRRRARQVAFALLVAVGIVNLLKGLDFGEALVGWTVAGVLYAGRGQFNVDHERITLRSAVWRVPLIGSICVALVVIADWVDHGRLKFGGKLLGESSALLRFKQGHDHFKRHSAGAFGHDIHFAWIPLGAHFMEIGTLLLVAYVIFRPLAAPQSWPSASVRRLAVEVVREHGQDTLSFFKLRPDKHYYFSQDRTAFVAYRVEAGTLLLSGDPVGPVETFPDLLLQVRGFARSRGLKLAAVGASEQLVKIYDELGLQALYIGDEAIVELDRFSLEGRPIRKVRQSVSRLTKAGFTAELRTLATLDRSTLQEIERVIELGRQGRPERGFSMAMDSIRGDCEQDTSFVLTRDGQGVIRGVLHFVPCYGRPAASLSMMRRDPSTPNGLTEFLVVRAIELLRERGIEEMSLNFATGARFMRAPKSHVEAGLGRLCHRLDRFFQIESLYRFNVKFFPRWDTRYLVYEGAFGLPRAALASMWAEGQIPKPRLPLMHA